MNSLALQIYTTLTNQETSQNELSGQDGMNKLAQQIKVAAQHRQNGTTPLKTGPLMGAHNPTANLSNVKVVPEDKMTKLAKSIMSAFAANKTQQNTNSTSPVKPVVVVVPEAKPNTTNTTNTTQPAQNITITEPVVVVVEVNKTQETNQTVQNNTTVAPVVVEEENNKTSETNQTTQTNQTSQPTQTNQTAIQTPEANQTKPTLPPVQSTRPIGIEKTETPKLEVEAECGDKIEHSLAIIYDLGVHAAAGNVDKVRRDYDALKTITLGLNKACYKSFSINVKPRPFFNNTGVCESELSELQKLAANYNQNSKDMISFAKTLQNFWYRHHNFVASCIPSTIGTIGIEKAEVPEMKVEDECANKIEHSLAIIYDLGVHSAAGNVEKVRRDYDALKTITLNLNKACSKSFSINAHPRPFFNNTGVCQSELSELQKLAVNYNQNSKDMISFAKTLQNFWYRHHNFVSSCMESSAIGIEKTQLPEMKVEDECADKIEHSLAIIYDLGVHSAAGNVEKVRRDYDALKTITLILNKACSKSFSINIHPHSFFNNTGVCESELSELQKLAVNYNKNSKDMISFAKTLQNFWYRHGNFVSSCVATSPAIGIEKTQAPKMKVEDECANKIEHSFAIIYNLGVHSAAGNVEKVRRDYDALKTITLNLNKACSKSFSINVHPHPFFNNTGICESELSELQKLAMNYNQNSQDIISFAKTIQNFWYRHINFVSSCVDNTTNSTQQPETQIREQRETNCILSFAEAISAVNKMNGNLYSWNPSASKTLINNLNTRIDSINNFCDAKFSINVESTQTQRNCQKNFILLKSVVENFISENSKDLTRVSQALRQISSVGKQVLSDC